MSVADAELPTRTIPRRADVRIDVVSIFPSFFDVLEVSLLGKARGSGLLDVRVHDLRDWTHDRHRTVDDTPYGGGAGMVMKPEPWGEALDAIATRGATPAAPARPVFIFPSPAGELFTQATARELADRSHLVFGCGRYEGIDERVFAHAASLGDVRLVSLGDYVLNGGEVAAMAMIEAIGRLIPGVVGNPASLRRGVARGRAAGVPVVHEAGRLARTGRARGAAERQPRRDRRVAARAAARAHARAPARPARGRRPRIVAAATRPRSHSRRRTNLGLLADPALPASASLWRRCADLARFELSARRDLRRQRHELRALQRGRRARRAVSVRRPRQGDARRADRRRRLRLARVPASGRAPGSATATACTARTTRPAARASTRTSCCSTPTPRPSKARSSGVSRSSATTSAIPTPATTRTPRHR